MQYAAWRMRDMTGARHCGHFEGLGAPVRRRKLRKYCYVMLVLAAITLVYMPKRAAADTGLGATASPATCDLAPYEAHLKRILEQNEYAIMQDQGMLFEHVFSSDQRKNIGAVIFGIASDGHVASAKLQQSTGSLGLDVLLLGAVRNSKFGPLPACFPDPVMAVKFYFIIPANTGD